MSHSALLIGRARKFGTAAVKVAADARRSGSHAAPGSKLLPRNDSVLPVARLCFDRARRSHVGKEQIDVHAATQCGSGLVHIVGLQDLIAKTAQHGDCGRPGLRICVDNEDGFGSALDKSFHPGLWPAFFLDERGK